jgi:rare lipoprotein A
MVILLLFLLVTGCANNETIRRHDYEIKNSHGTFKVYVQKHFQFDEEGIASYYTYGHTTALGEKFNTNYYTAAHPYLPIPCIAEVSLTNNPAKKVIVKINDRGPFTKQKRVIDLSKAAAEKLGFVKSGLARVRVKVLIKETLALKEHGGHIVCTGKTEQKFHS